MKEAQKGFATAFERLVNGKETRIFHVALHITHNEEGSRDAMQESWMKTYQYLGLKNRERANRFNWEMVR
ncbi:MAG TPA: hypothetical protein VNJ12_09535 [Candidatus Dormibacteraeota bacterium]|nr:hypothetical protein [Candidatus Dormibacteraeota bacterium]